MNGSSSMTRQEEGKQLLKQLVTFLNLHDRDSKMLWAVLTALRGPDNENEHDLKEETTARIRNAVGLKPGVGNGASVSSYLPPVEDASIETWTVYGDSDHVVRKYQIKYFEKVQKHFIKHYAWAVAGLRHFGLING